MSVQARKDDSVVLAINSEWVVVYDQARLIKVILSSNACIVHVITTHRAYPNLTIICRRNCHSMSASTISTTQRRCLSSSTPAQIPRAWLAWHVRALFGCFECLHDAIAAFLKGQPNEQAMFIKTRQVCFCVEWEPRSTHARTGASDYRASFYHYKEEH